jgi:catechol 1,2-dioxygenase
MKPSNIQLPTTPESILPLVIQAMSRTPDARLRELMASLTSHLHAFILETQVTEEEFERAVKFLIDIGQATGEKTNEVILAADLLGVSSLVAVLNNPANPLQHDSHATEEAASHAALLGPFWRANAPFCQAGDSIARGNTQGIPLEVRGVVYDKHGQPLPNATVDVWHASPVGLYENQDDAQENMNLRGRFKTDAHGAYFFRTVRPAGYPVPTNGPCGDLLRAQLRHPNRPAHLHFMVSTPGHKVLITQVFADGDDNLTSDPVFGVTAALVGNFEMHMVNGQPQASLTHDFHLVAGDMTFPHPPIP